jgi:hypothetical protein
MTLEERDISALDGEALSAPAILPKNYIEIKHDLR